MSLTQYIKDTRGEMKHVSWPTRHQVVVYTTAVVVVSIITALFLGAFDWVFSQGVNEILFNAPLPTVESLGVEVNEVPAGEVQLETPEDQSGETAPTFDIAPTN